MLDHEIDHIVDRLIDKLAVRLAEPLIHILRREIKLMTDAAVQAVSDASDAIVAELGEVVTDLQKVSGELTIALANSGAANDPALLAIAGRLSAGTKAAKDAVTALTPAPVASPLPSPAPVESPAPEPAPAAPAQTA